MGKKGKRKKRRHVPGRGQRVPARRRVESFEPPLLVFVSSAICGMEQEREAVRQAVESIHLARPWLFEQAPASSQECDESYLEKVRECDLFVLLIGTLDRDAVRREYETAVRSGRPVLVFVQQVQRPPALQQFVDSISTKRASYATLEDLHCAARASVADEISRTFRKAIRSPHVENVVEALVPSEPKRQLKELFGRVVFGLESESSSIGLFKLFGGVVMDRCSSVETSAFEDLVFDDMAEVAEVNAALQRAMTAMEGKAETERAPAFMQAWQNEVLRRVSRHIVRRPRIVSTKVRKAIPGVRYVVLETHPEYAPLIRLLRPAEIVDGATALERDAQELVFEDPTLVQDMYEVIQEVSQSPEDDPKELLSLLLEGAMRVRLSRMT